MKSNILSNKALRLFLLLGAFFITNALVAEFIGVKIFQLESTFGFKPVDWKIFGNPVSLQYTAGVLLWPVVFVMTDVINEYFGRKGVKMLSYLAVGMIIFAFLIVYGAIALDPAGWWTDNYKNQGVDNMQNAYRAVFGQGLFIIVGSLIAFLIGQLVDVFTFHKIRKVTGEKKIWLRATGSTLISQLIDSFVVLGIAFYIGPMLFKGGGEPWSFNQLMAIGTNNYIYKFVMAVVLTPVIYLAHDIIDKYLGKDLADELKEQASL